jgi:hypothetical protein
MVRLAYSRYFWLLWMQTYVKICNKCVLDFSTDPFALALTQGAATLGLEDLHMLY